MPIRHRLISARIGIGEDARCNEHAASMILNIGKWASRIAVLLLAVASYSTLTAQLAATARKLDRLAADLRQGSTLLAISPEAVAVLVWGFVVLMLAYALFDLRESRPRVYGALVIAAGAAIGGMVGLSFLRSGITVDQSLAALGGAMGAVDGFALWRRPPR